MFTLLTIYHRTILFLAIYRSTQYQIMDQLSSLFRYIPLRIDKNQIWINFHIISLYFS